MKIPHFNLTFNAAVVALTLIWFTSFAFTRVSLFLDVYNEAEASRLEHLVLHENCQNHAKTRIQAPNECRQHELLSKKKSYQPAFQAVAVETLDLFVSMWHGIRGMLFYIILATVSSLFLFSIFTRITGPSVAKSLRYNDEYDNYNIEQAPVKVNRISYAYESAPRIRLQELQN